MINVGVEVGVIDDYGAHLSSDIMTRFKAMFDTSEQRDIIFHTGKVKRVIVYL